VSRAFLVAAGLVEIAWSQSIKPTHNLTRPVPTLAHYTPSPSMHGIRCFIGPTRSRRRARDHVATSEVRSSDAGSGFLSACGENRSRGRRLSKIRF